MRKILYLSNITQMLDDVIEKCNIDVRLQLCNLITRRTYIVVHIVGETILVRIYLFFD
jgi:hypothetical protein